jgi:hypothetical protein
MKAKILLPYNGTEPTMRAVEYVAKLLGKQSDVFVTLFRLMPAVPPSLREHGGAENPTDETAIGCEYEQKRKAWEECNLENECIFFGPARSMLKKAGFADDQIFGMCRFPETGSDLAQEILKECREHNYDTIVLSRRGLSGLRALFGGNPAEKLAKQTEGLAVWIVE